MILTYFDHIKRLRHSMRHHEYPWMVWMCGGHIRWTKPSSKMGWSSHGIWDLPMQPEVDEVPFLSLVRIPLFAGSVSPYWWSNRHFGDFKSYEHCFIPGHSKPVLVASNPWQPWLRFCCCISFLCWWMPFLLLANVLEFSASFPFIASKKSCRPVGEVYRYEPPFKSI